MYSSVISGTIIGLESHLIRVEVDIAPGLPCFQMVGLLSGEVRESKERVKVALKNTGYNLPPMSINVNLSPADIRKEGTAFDLPIALGILSSQGLIPELSLDNTLSIGELGLNGEIKGVRGILPLVIKAKSLGITTIILPAANASEASLISDLNIVPVSSLKEVVDILNKHNNLSSKAISTQSTSCIENMINNSLSSLPDFADVYGQTTAKRAAMVAAAGFHHLLMIGPPGSGKTMIAQRIPSILPPLTAAEALELTSIYSVAGLLDPNQSLITTRPFLSPHSSISEISLAGGGIKVRPGVITLAHRGVLFLDEMTEFDRNVLDIMRQPLESKEILISRSSGAFKYPADFMLVAACNPCPCGYYPNLNKCHCSDPQVKRYLGRISGPLLDRIDICCNVEPSNLCKPDSNYQDITTSDTMRKQIHIARLRQEDRFKNSPLRFNSEMSGKDISKYCSLDANGTATLQTASETLDLSARSYHRILKVARTIADLADCESIAEEHISEAIFYRTSGLRFWGR